MSVKNTPTDSNRLSDCVNNVTTLCSSISLPDTESQPVRCHDAINEEIIDLVDLNDDDLDPVDHFYIEPLNNISVQPSTTQQIANPQNNPMQTLPNTSPVLEQTVKSEETDDDNDEDSDDIIEIIDLADDSDSIESVESFEDKNRNDSRDMFVVLACLHVETAIAVPSV